MRATVSVYAADGTTLIAHVPRRKAVQWQEELNAPGSGKFEIHQTDQVLLDNPTLLDYFNIVKISLNGVAIKAWVIEQKDPVYTSSGEVEANWISVSGRGLLSLLEAAVVYPEYGLNPYMSEDRLFNFASKDGPWKISGEWVAPVAVAFNSDTTGKKASLSAWPDTSASWIWSSNPNGNSAPGRNWFRSEITLTAATDVIIYATADNFAEVSLDGAAVIYSASFREISVYRARLAPGLHTIAAWVDNLAAPITPANPTGVNPAGFLFSMYSADAAGNRVAVLLRSAAAGWTVRTYGAAPGWHAASILQQTVEEAQARNVTALLPVTLGFTPTADSASVAWTDRLDRIVKVPTTDLYNLAQQLVEMSFDIDINPSLVLNAWINRGTDLSSTVILRNARDITGLSASQNGSKLKNQALLHSDVGWLEIFNSTSKELYGRREAGISAGNDTSFEQMTLTGTAAIREVSRPEDTTQLTYTSAKGQQPYTDYAVGDIISVPNAQNVIAPARVMAITAAEQEGYITWDIDLYPEIPADEVGTATVSVTQSNGIPTNIYQAEVLSDSPWGYWRQTETSGASLVDISGNARTFVIGNPGSGNILAQPGPLNKAVIWSRDTTAYARTATAVSKFNFQYATLEAWIYLTENPIGNTAIIVMSPDTAPGGSTTHDKDFYIRSDGKLAFFCRQNNGVSDTTVATSATPLNVWNHVVATVGINGMFIYRNTVAVAHSAAVLSSYSTPQFVYMRGGSSVVDIRGAIRIAEPAVYFQELSSSRITSHYNAALAVL